ncbi:MAG: peptidoglycan D,D-transpeptidase FtsI family protein [Ktedonobacterales bacterium]|jgi:cell division protein FtsI/penicillin-binding protein 2
MRQEADQQDHRPATSIAGMARRQALLLGLVVVVMVGLLARTAWWQIAQGAILSRRAAQESVRLLSIPAARGSILDANGVALAVSVTRESVIVDPDLLRATNAMRPAEQALSKALGLPVAALASQMDVSGAYVRLLGADGQPLLLTATESAAAQAAIDAAQAQGGVVLAPVSTREYPDGALAGQTLGFVRQSDGAGQYGVEQMENSALAGTPGELYTRVSQDGQPLALAPLRQTAAIPGANVTLTLDATVQLWAEQGLANAVRNTAADGGEVIVMDPRTGGIIAMASTTSFDPNTYQYASLSSFSNPAISDVYDPGSVMKAVTMAAGIQAGVITPQTTFFDPGYVDVAGVRIYNFDHNGHGEENMTQVLQHSANVGAVFVAQRVGAADFYQTLHAFGFGQTTGSGLPGEVRGLRGGGHGENPELTLAENAFGESIGVTPLQLTQAYAALANGGVLMRPHVVASVTTDGGLGATTTYAPQIAQQVVSPQTAATVTQMLTQSALQSDAHMALLPGYSIAAKTGTSTPYPNDPGWTYASVVGYAPASHPRFVLLVKLDHPRRVIFGGDAAGPLWRALAQQLFLYYRIPPDQSAG